MIGAGGSARRPFRGAFAADRSTDGTAACLHGPRGGERTGPRPRSAPLSPDDRRRLHAVRRALSATWLDDDYRLELARRVRGLFPGSAITLYTRRPDGALADHIHDLTNGLGRSRLSSRAMRLIQSGHLYKLRGQDPNANRAIGTAELFRGRAARLELFRDAVLHPYGAYYQLRIALYHGERFAAFLGFVRSRAHGDYSAAEQALLDALSPQLVDGLVLTSLLERSGSGCSQLARALAAFHEPAFLLTEHGAIVHANPAARAGGDALPSWLCDVPRLATLPPMLGCVAQVELDRRPLWLVVPRRRTRFSSAAAAGRLTDLPPSLSRVAELLLAGLADKEIAERTELSLATVRTYSPRIYRRVGVHSRAELIALAACDGAGAEYGGDGKGGHLPAWPARRAGE